MNLIPILVGAFGRKWRRRKNVNLALNNIPLPLFALASAWPPEAGGVRAAGREKRGGAKERKGERNKTSRVRQDREKRRTVQGRRDERGDEKWWAARRRGK